MCAIGFVGEETHRDEPGCAKAEPYRDCVESDSECSSRRSCAVLNRVGEGPGLAMTLCAGTEAAAIHSEGDFD